jgi:hypothetical protein
VHYLPLSQGGVVDFHQLYGGLHHDDRIGQDELPDPLVGPTHQGPPKNTHTSRASGKWIDVAELGDDAFHVAVAVCPLGRSSTLAEEASAN